MKLRPATFGAFVFVCSLSLAPPAVPPAHAQAQAAPAERAIVPVADGLYRWTAGAYHSLFLVTEKGIVVTDPLSAEAAGWLRGELAARFPGKPITHVLYSHNHSDHVYGGEALDGPGTQFVAHALAREDLVRTRAATRIPDIAFADRLTLHPDATNSIELTYLGSNNGRGSVAMLFRPQKVLHVVDWIVLGRLPYQDLKGYDLPGMIEATRQVLAWDFDRFVGGHADMGTKQDVARYLAYLEALHDGVLDGIRRGHSLARIQRELTLSDYADLKQFAAWRARNIEGAYRTLVDDHYLLMRPDVPQPPAR